MKIICLATAGHYSDGFLKRSAFYVLDGVREQKVTIIEYTLTPHATIWHDMIYYLLCYNQICFVIDEEEKKIILYENILGVHWKCVF